MLFHVKILLLSLFGLNTLASSLPVSNVAPATRRGSSLNEFLSVLLDRLPAINTTVIDSSSLITEFDKVIASLTRAQTTYNELGGPCKEWTVIFARGTTEPGNVCHPSLYFAPSSFWTDVLLGRSARWAPTT